MNISSPPHVCLGFARAEAAEAGELARTVEKSPPGDNSSNSSHIYPPYNLGLDLENKPTRCMRDVVRAPRLKIRRAFPKAWTGRMLIASKMELTIHLLPLQVPCARPTTTLVETSENESPGPHDFHLCVQIDQSSCFRSSKHCAGKLVFQGDDLRRSLSDTSSFPLNRALRPISLGRLLAAPRAAGGPRVAERRDSVSNAERGQEERGSGTRQPGVWHRMMMCRKGE